ncbi:MAG: PAS domain-containing protein [Roseiflexaceae bacterium]
MPAAPTTNPRSPSLDPWALLAALPDQVIVVDTQGCIQYRNAVSSELNGLGDDIFPIGGAYQACFRAAFAPRDTDATALAVGLQAVLAGDLPRFDLDHPYQVAGHERWGIVTVVPWAAEKGGALILHRDITERWRDEQALRQAEAIFAVIPDMMFRLSQAGEYLDCKISGDHELYAPPEQIIGKHLHDLMPTETAAAWLDAITRTLDRGRMQVYEYRMPTPKGWCDFEARMVVSGVGEVLTIVRDVTEHKRAEEALRNSANQQQIIRLQAAALRDLATPLIPISSQVVAMPLVGAVDTQRAQQVIEALLRGIATSRARAAILDITGVPLVDTQVANTLVQAAQAVRLLGAQVILTGIRPEVAQTLVGLGVDLAGLVTRATLQDGIAYAMRQGE